MPFAKFDRPHSTAKISASLDSGRRGARRCRKLATARISLYFAREGRYVSGGCLRLAWSRLTRPSLVS